MPRFDAISRESGFRADQSALIEKALSYIMKKVYEKRYKHLKSRMLIPVNNEGGAGLSTISYLTSELTGQAKILGAAAGDLGKSNSKIKQVDFNVATIGTAAIWTQQELEKFNRTGISVSDKQAKGSRRSVEQLVDKIAALGDQEFNIKGMFSDFNILTEKTGETLVGKTGDEMYDILLPIINNSMILTDSEFVNDVLILPTDEMEALAGKRMPNSDMTVIKYIQENTSITTIGSWTHLNGVKNGSNVIAAYPRDPEVLELLIPRELQYFNLQLHDLEYKVPGLLDIAGTALYQPKLISYMEV